MLLRQTIDAWLAEHPHLVIDKTQPVAEAGETVGIQVWYHVAGHRVVPPSPGPSKSPGLLNFEVSEPIPQRLPREHIEAFIDEAIQVWHAQPDRHVTLAVVNARRLVVIVDGHVSRGAVLPVEGVLDALDDEQRRQLQTWLGSLPTRLHVIKIGGSWFARREEIGKRRKLWEPGCVRTNMTYDPGRRPGV